MGGSELHLSPVTRKFRIQKKIDLYFDATLQCP